MKATFRAERRTHPLGSDMGPLPGVLVSYTEAGASRSVSEVRDDVGTIAGATVETSVDGTAFAVVDFDRLDEAREELRALGYDLDVSEFATLREVLGDLSDFETGRLRIEGEERRAALLALASDSPASVSYGEIDPARTAEEADVVSLPLLVGSDYSGGSVTRSNVATFRRILDEADSRLRLDASGGHGTDGVFAFLDVRTTVEAAGAVAEALRGLLDYPLLDEEHHSALEMEEANESWECHARRDFEAALEERIGGIEVEDSDGVLREVFDARAGVANVNGGPGIEHDEEGPRFYVDEVAEATPAALLAFLGLLKVDVLDVLLDVAIPGTEADRDECRRLARILSVGQALRLHVRPALVRGMVVEHEARHGAIEKGDVKFCQRQAEAIRQAREVIMRADFDEGDPSAPVSSDDWESEARLVRVELRRHVWGPNGVEQRRATIDLDPTLRYLYGPVVDEAVLGLFDDEPREEG